MKEVYTFLGLLIMSLTVFAQQAPGTVSRQNENRTVYINKNCRLKEVKEDSSANDGLRLAGSTAQLVSMGRMFQTKEKTALLKMTNYKGKNWSVLIFPKLITEDKDLRTSAYSFDTNVGSTFSLKVTESIDDMSEEVEISITEGNKKTTADYVCAYPNEDELENNQL